MLHRSCSLCTYFYGSFIQYLSQVLVSSPCEKQSGKKKIELIFLGGAALPGYMYDALSGGGRLVRGKSKNKCLICLK